MATSHGVSEGFAAEYNMGGVEGTAMTETTKLDFNRARASEKW